MTLVNEDKEQDAFFGWNRVVARGTPGGSAKFEDVGPNKVYALGTFD